MTESSEPVIQQIEPPTSKTNQKTTNVPLFDMPQSLGPPRETPQPRAMATPSQGQGIPIPTSASLARLGAQFSPDQMRTAIEVLTFLTQTRSRAQVLRTAPEVEVEQRRKRPRPQNSPNVWRRNLQQEMEGADSQEYEAESITPSRAQPRARTEQAPSQRHHSGSSMPNPTRAIVKPDNSPFCDEILSEKMEKIKMPTCKYSGKSDPTNHLSAFGGHMMLYTNTDSMWCKVFPSTLEGIAQSWFGKIPKGTITSFRQLAILFRTQYVANIARERMTGELMSVIQGPHESLREYISRFNMEASNIPKLQQEVAVLAMMTGLRDGEFKSYLGRKSFTTLAEVLGKANEFIKSEEIGRATSRRYVAKECTHLKDNIEDLIRRGYLTQFKAKSLYSRTYENRDDDGRFDNRKTEQKQNHPADQKRSNDILVITGGPVYADTTASSAKASVSEFKHQVNYHNSGKWPAPPKIPQCTFAEDDCKGIIYPHDDPMVLALDVANRKIHRILIDGGSSANILFWPAFQELQIEEKHVKPVNYPVIGFTRATVIPEGIVSLPVQIGQGKDIKDVMVDFMIVKVPAAYNAILGRPFIHDAGAVVSTYHLTMMYTTNDNRSAKVKGNQEQAKRCYHTALKQPPRPPPLAEAEIPWSRKRKRVERKKDALLDMENFEHREEGLLKPAPAEGTEEIELEEGVEERTVRIGTDIDLSLRVNIIGLLREHADIFAFSADEIPGIDPSVMVHRLNVNREVRPVKQKKRTFSTEKNVAIQEEISKLLAAKFMEECDYPEWLANVVMVKKANDQWRMCVDFADLNRAYPKDCYPLPRIDQLVDSTSGHALLSFMDAFSGYHQISLLESDRKKAAFITDAGVYNYRAMPFGLKNAGATYQKLVDKIFAGQKGRNVEVYVDDSIVKSKKEADHIEDLKETFATLRQFGMKLNPKKCVFGVKSGKFLGFLVSERGIDANPEKVEAILNLPEPKNIRDIQRLTGKMAALTRFISKSADKSLPFFQVLKGNKTFKWEEEQEKAFKEVKNHLKSLPTIARPEVGDILQLYISASKKTVAAALVVEKDKIQQPVNFVSHILNPAEQRYPLIEKMAFAIMIAARKLKPYFDAHKVQVLTNQPLEKSLQRLDTSGRLLKWAVELSEYDIEYKPRTAIKAQALADFIVKASYEEEEEPLGTWQISVDGSAAVTGSGAGIIMVSPEGNVFEYAIKFKFKASNNEAEYEAAIAGIQMCKAADAKKIVLKTDSQLVASPYRGEYEAREPSMQRYLALMKEAVAQLESFEIQLVPRAEKNQADALSKLASSTLQNLERTVMVEVQEEKSIDKKPAVNFIDTEPQWYDSIVSYKLGRGLPTAEQEQKKVKRNEHWFVIYQGKLYKKSFSLPLLRCVSTEESQRVIEEIHEGICGNHIGGRTLALKALRAGYYWPTMVSDSQAYVKKCDKCQKFAPVINQPSNDLQPIINPIPFAQWGMDILGPFTAASGGRKFMIVAVDYFTKWIEAEPTKSITAKRMKDFIWKNIVTRFGIPESLVFDHGTQFDCTPIKDYCAELRIKFAYASVCHPQSNGQEEAANKQILGALRKKVEDFKGAWADLIPEILWSNRTTENEATGESPYKLAFGAEAVLPIEVGLPSFRVQYYEEGTNEQRMREALDLLPEVRLQVELRLAANKEKMSRAYNKRVKHRPMQVGDLVLRRTAATGKGKAEGKFTANWEGPYQITKEVAPGSYHLMKMEGRELKNSWNANMLKKYYV
ncbi:uncharacterized protein [Spinacia oleracea]|uniref:Uncharacterized protein n=1 Tax=Spinacia oleracea TaxID=3562 RepID=A0ABM3R891_SPIOL|nr:uncharacterized protein LOC130467357 [Spinacia oleracea]